MAQVTELSATATPGKIHSFSAKPTAGNTLVLRIKYGSKVLLASPAVSMTPNLSNVAWAIEGLFIVRSIGANGTLMATGDFDNSVDSNAIANTSAVTVDTTASTDIEVSAQWSAAAAGNTIEAQNVFIEKHEL